MDDIQYPSIWWLDSEARKQLYASIFALERSVQMGQPIKDRLVDLIQSANVVLESETDHEWEVE